MFCFITGFGADGPYANRAAYDNVGQALSGWLARHHDSTDPRVAGPAISDAATGIFACLGIVSALLERTKTGIGRKVEVSMLEATLALAIEPLAHYFVTGSEQPFHLRGAMSQAYVLTCQDGERIALQMSSPDKFWQGLAAVIEQPDLLARYPDRKSRVGELRGDRARARRDIRDQTAHEWLARLAQHDVPFAPERRLSELEEDPQARHLDLFYDLTHPAAGTVRSVHRADPLRRQPGDRFPPAADPGRAHARGAHLPGPLGRRARHPRRAGHYQDAELSRAPWTSSSAASSGCLRTRSAS